MSDYMQCDPVSIRASRNANNWEERFLTRVTHTYFRISRMPTLKLPSKTRVKMVYSYVCLQNTNTVYISDNVEMESQNHIER